MSDPGMEFPKPADFDEEARQSRRPRITVERMLVLGLLLFGGLFLGLATEFWPEDNRVGDLFNPLMNVAMQSPEEELRNNIINRLRNNDLEQALLLCERLIELDAAQGYELRARIYAAEENFEEALADADRLAETDPKKGYLLKGNFLVEQEDYAKAAEAFGQLIEADPASGVGYRLRALCYLEIEEIDKAVADSRQLAEIAPVPGFDLEGIIYERRGEYAKAAEVYSKAIEVDAENSPAWHGRRYMAHINAEDYQGAVDDADAIIKVEPSRGYIMKGDALARLNKSDEALEAYSKALGHDPTNATALNNRAYHLATIQENLVEAAKDVEEAIDIGGEQPAFVDTRGFISYLRGDFKQALADFNQALRDADAEGLDPEFSAEILFHRGLVHRKLGEEELAEQDFAKAKELGFEWDEMPEPVSG